MRVTTTARVRARRLSGALTPMPSTRTVAILVAGFVASALVVGARVKGTGPSSAPIAAIAISFTVLGLLALDTARARALGRLMLATGLSALIPFALSLRSP